MATVQNANAALSEMDGGAQKNTLLLLPYHKQLAIRYNRVFRPGRSYKSITFERLTLASFAL